MFKDFYGLPPGLTLRAGLSLLVFAVGMWLAASPRTFDARAVVTIIVLNIAWVVASVVVLAASLLPLTALGVGSRFRSWRSRRSIRRRRDRQAPSADPGPSEVDLQTNFGLGSSETRNSSRSLLATLSHFPRGG